LQYQQALNIDIITTVIMVVLLNITTIAAQPIVAAAAIVQPVASVLAAPLAERHAALENAATAMFHDAEAHAAAGGNPVEEVKNCNLLSLTKEGRLFYFYVKNINKKY
jgi:hypothetical protein